MTHTGLHEKNFEADIEQYLLTKGGYTKGSQATYDKEKAIDLDTLIRFVKDSQPKAWERFERKYGNSAKTQLYKTIQGGKSSVSCPLKPSDSAPLKHSTMPP